MNILFCGGEKTINIVEALKETHKGSSIKFNWIKHVSSLDDILSELYSGEVYDRVIFIEQCWTNDGEITDSDSIRKIISNLNEFIKNNKKQLLTQVFVAATSGMAQIVAEETIELGNTSLILLKDKPYYVGFFSKAAVNSLSSINEKYVFKMDRNRKEEVGKAVMNVVDSIEETINIEIDGGNKIEDNFDLEDSLMDEMKLQEGIDFEHEEYYGKTEEELQISYEEESEAGDNPEELEEVFDEFEDFDESELTILDESELEYENLDETQSTDNVAIEQEDSLEESFGDSFEESLNELSNVPLETPSIEESLNDFESEDKVEVKISNNPFNNQNNVTLPQTKQAVKSGRKALRLGKKEPEKKSQKVAKEEKTYAKTSNDSKVIDLMQSHRIRGTSIVVTGTGGSGASTVAFNIANHIVNSEFNVLIVDFDIKNRTQSYITNKSYRAVHSIDSSKASLRNAIKTVESGGLMRSVDIVKPGLNLLTIGLNCNQLKMSDIADMNKTIRMEAKARDYYNAIIYDIPFEYVVDDLYYMSCNSDRIVIVVDGSTWGMMKLMSMVGNIVNEDALETIQNRGQLLFNKVKEPMSNRFGGNGRNFRVILNRLDGIVKELTGISGGVFERMHVCGLIPYIEEMDKFWFSEHAFSDTPLGADIFRQIIDGIFLVR